MRCNEFLRETICGLSQSTFAELRLMLLRDYISFSIIDPENVTEEVLAEKLCDYFDLLETKTGKPFDKRIEQYMEVLDTLIEPRIAQTPRTKKNASDSAITPRSRKYYEKAVKFKSIKNPSVTRLIDYTRIMMCLYTAWGKSDGKPIQNFDYSANCLSPQNLYIAFKNEESSGLLSRSKKKRFETKDLYSEDVCFLIMLMILLFTIVDGKVEGEIVDE